ncbi:PTS glucose transporter subunit IIB [Pseudomonas brassicacearum]|uniref:PTS glucose transporter subunit IIB n=1 Tax=Pseudomonas brassicacearum TaxID=930166 RepID=A0A423H885_9PSED|nr:PTS transporter subunit EIIB [Pseudomonas brassicacearum]RON09400.1 PTS glucose transporter subunit IIB [Pseudomonas brassicacearum]
MFEKMQRAFWKALTPDLLVDEPKVARSSSALLTPSVMAALGGAGNLKSRQRVALTRVRVELKDAALLDATALRAAGVPGVMMLEDGVVHLITGLQA